ncbi:MAG: Rieske (2Fe-2S) protein [Methanoregula sp.]
MSQFIPVAYVTEFRDGTLWKAMAGSTPVLLARVNGQFYAMELLCPHLGADLSGGQSVAQHSPVPSTSHSLMCGTGRLCAGPI